MMTERRLVSPVPSPFRQQYSLHEELGRGSYAIVHRCVQSNTSQQYAVKVVDKTKANPSQLEDLKQEVGIMKELKHPYIISMKDIFDTELTLYIVMELVHGGDVFTVITKWTQYGESIAAEMLHNFITAIQYLHNNNIVHRDLKPDNILISQALPKSKSDLQLNPSVLTDIKVADFGFSTHCGPVDDLKKCCGTPYYIAPEILNCGLYKTGPPYGKQCDMWSVGVIAYVIMSGAPPFQAQKRHQLFKIIVKGKFAFSGGPWDSISEGAKDFIRGLLVLDPKQRMTPSQALAHPWIRNRSRSISQTVLPKMQQTKTSDFKPKLKFKAGVFCVIAIHRLVYLQKKKDDAPQRKSLKKLVLRNNEIETTSLDTIVHTLARHPSITHLDLSHHPLSKHSAKKILYVLQVNPYIRKVEVDGNVVQASRIKSVESLMQTGPAAANANMALPAISTRS